MVPRKRPPRIRCKGVPAVLRTSQRASGVHAQQGPYLVSESMQPPAELPLHLVEECPSRYGRAAPSGTTRGRSQCANEPCDQLQELTLYERERESYNAELRMKLLELAEIKQHYYDLYHRAPIADCCIDAEGRILQANLRAAELFGAPVENLKGQRLTRFIPSEAAHDLCHLQQRSSFHTSDRAPFELRVRSISGTDRRVLALLTIAFSDDDATPVGRVTFMDVSDYSLKKWLEELKPQPTNTEELEPVGKLAATIAHDFNNLLAGIMASVTLLEFEHTDQLARTEHLNDIRALTERGAQLTRQLLGIARGGKLQLVPLDLNAIIESLADTFQRRHDGLAIRLALSPSNRQLLADRSQIEQMLTNLLNNAYGALGGVGEILVNLDEIELATLEAHHHGVQPGTYFKLSVADRGPGTSDEVWPGGFKPFASTRACINGQSAGLASVHRIVKNHRGFVSAASVPGQ